MASGDLVPCVPISRQHIGVRKKLLVVGGVDGCVYWFVDVVLAFVVWKSEPLGQLRAGYEQRDWKIRNF